MFETIYIITLTGIAMIAVIAFVMARIKIYMLELQLKHFRKLDAEAAEVEKIIATRTQFTGYPPYFGWNGLALALNEALDDRDSLHIKIKQSLEVMDD